ncbi:16S rRNA (cytosine(1402)-N(4))-methyltransferase RsmH [Glaciimonas sp. CA11.2]|uniref:16S rRNA (cytosine(1402)-N(4))-methyltransferase RsmH n=1 Tax=unclassified Glaciimonas TaxID=2644401 RepID=UPI002AB59A44|nr:MULTISPECIES: 16S rRNA (cytosine(1402)-N(4))-methyltransferase RsmH [unclassified Glaciimonas]MDY7546487.1 16S rRNA (cytosine(1402)-N(4))-methyltransferase RsmH [Glaciimonas sp. CA11.2]MEB0012878.1 16S rRNA (cytosine(1402)-N(4))-methyltransferase RsmH [Glaciimonas sp. Cout2]MEB0080831.1 16S rRNA (cytosine(1402)-N(4))-methyltransferase RsmH [Glaciimonas sp. Gout2]MEB0161751.1 16S rRNA (cytosine(1402)-N(4))-methyltransferase RsmH [Glaciimonas sp. CA11.2]
MTEQSVPEFQHRTVLLDEAVEALNIVGPRADGVYVDGTFGRGGHSRKILESLGPMGRLIAFDKDPQAIATANTITDPRFEIVHDSFATMAEALRDRHIAQVDGVLLDLGISSPQVDDASRGFSFRADGPLDMRMDTTRGMSAAAWLAIADEQTIGKVVRDYGEERFAVQIAKAIVAGRAVQPISTTRQLAAIVANAVKTREKGKDPATRTFQAIRIYINKELEELKIVLDQAFEQMSLQGRLVVISFHSLEDRIVKQYMASKAKLPQPDRRLPILAVDLPQPQLKLVSRVKPSDAEVTANPRSRSAIMRVGERLASSAKSGLMTGDQS